MRRKFCTQSGRLKCFNVREVFSTAGACYVVKRFVPRPQGVAKAGRNNLNLTFLPGRCELPL